MTDLNKEEFDFDSISIEDNASQVEKTNEFLMSTDQDSEMFELDMNYDGDLSGINTEMNNLENIGDEEEISDVYNESSLLERTLYLYYKMWNFERNILISKTKSIIQNVMSADTSTKRNDVSFVDDFYRTIVQPELIYRAENAKSNGIELSNKFYTEQFNNFIARVFKMLKEPRERLMGHRDSETIQKVSDTIQETSYAEFPDLKRRTNLEKETIGLKFFGLMAAMVNIGEEKVNILLGERLKEFFNATRTKANVPKELLDSIENTKQLLVEPLVPKDFLSSRLFYEVTPSENVEFKSTVSVEDEYELIVEIYLSMTGEILGKTSCGAEIKIDKAMAVCVEQRERQNIQYHYAVMRGVECPNCKKKALIPEFLVTKLYGVMANDFSMEANIYSNSIKGTITYQIIYYTYDSFEDTRSILSLSAKVPDKPVIEEQSYREAFRKFLDDSNAITGSMENYELPLITYILAANKVNLNYLSLCQMIINLMQEDVRTYFDSLCGTNKAKTKRYTEYRLAKELYKLEGEDPVNRDIIEHNINLKKIPPEEYPLDELKPNLTDIVKKDIIKIIKNDINMKTYNKYVGNSSIDLEYLHYSRLSELFNELFSIKDDDYDASILTTCARNMFSSFMLGVAKDSTQKGSLKPVLCMPDAMQWTKELISTMNTKLRVQDKIVDIDSVFSLMDRNPETSRTLAISNFSRLFDKPVRFTPRVELTLNGTYSELIEAFQQCDNMEELLPNFSTFEDTVNASIQLPQWARNSDVQNNRLETNAKSLLLLALLEAFPSKSWSSLDDYRKCEQLCATI